MLDEAKLDAQTSLATENIEDMIRREVALSSREDACKETEQATNRQQAVDATNTNAGEYTEKSSCWL